ADRHDDGQRADAEVDGSGNLWVVGTTTSDVFPVTDDAYDATKAAFDDGYVVKLDSQGRVVYATYLGGDNVECMGGVALTPDGDVVVVGTTISENFPVTAGAIQDVNQGGQGDGFLVKLDAAGQLLYSTYFGGTGAEYCQGRGNHWADVAAAPDGALYFLLGTTASSEFPAPGATGCTLRR